MGDLKRALTPYYADWHLSKFKSSREKEGVAAQTIKHNFQVIRSVIVWAKDHEYLVKPVDFPKLKSPKHRLRYLSDEEESRLLAELDPKHHHPFRPAYEKMTSREKPLVRHRIKILYHLNLLNIPRHILI